MWAPLLLLVVAAPACLARGGVAQSAQLDVGATALSCADCTLGASLLIRSLPDAAQLVHGMQSRVCPGAANPQQCRNQAATILPVLLAHAKSSVTPSSLCAGTTACSGSQGALLSLMQQPAQLQDGPACAMCTFLINRVKLYLNDTAVQQSILDAANKACSELPAEFATSCTQFVNTYEPLLLQYVEATDPSLMCMLAGVCLVARTTPAPPVPKAPMLPMGLLQPLAPLSHVLTAGTPPSNDSCDICKMAVIEAHSLVSNPDVQANLITYTKALCAFAGGPITHECDDFVDTYAPTAFTYMEEMLDPVQLCTQLGVCQLSLSQTWRAQGQALGAKLRLGQLQAQDDALNLPQ